MSTTITQFTIPHNLGFAALQKKLAADPRLHYEGRQTFIRTFFDTFDWLLFNANRTLERECRQQYCQLRLRQLRSDQSVFVLGHSEEPGLASSLPDGVFRRQLEKIIEARRVLPLFSIRSTQYIFSLRNDEGKILVRLVIEQNTLLLDKGKNRSLGKRLRLLPLRGYRSELGQMIEYVSSNLRLLPSTEDVVVRGLHAIGRQPNDYTLKQETVLSPEMPAGLACKLIQQPLLDVMRRNEQGILDNIDIEFLHDYRVAARAARAILMQCKKIYNPEVSQYLANELKWLGEVTGPLRDADVYLQRMPEYQQQLPDKLIAGLDIFKNYLHEQHSIYLGKVREIMLSERYDKFFLAWKNFIADRNTEKDTSTIIQHANSRVDKMYRRVIREGNAITNQSPDSDLHELRKTCKKLRYLLEYMQNLYDRKSTRLIIHALKKLQNNLGEFQDLCIQIETLNHFNDTIVDTRKYHKSKKALMQLVRQMQKHKRGVRKEFHKVFTGFDTANTHDLLNGLLSTSTDNV
jgi:CHAD domain-containing protein